MANRPLHIGVIGCGAQAQNHLSVVRELGDEIARVEVICDLREERLEEGRALWPEARLCRDYREALKDGDLDLVIVVTMPATHAEICLAAFAAGAHVLCEKPFVTSLEEAETVLAAARQANRQIQLGTNMRYMPGPLYLRDLLASGQAGEPVQCTIRGCHRNPPVHGPHYQLAQSGGGVLASTLVHGLDLALWVGGSPNPVALSATAKRLFPLKRGSTASTEVRQNYDAEDLLSAFVRFDNGAVYILQGNWCAESVEDAHGFEMITTRGTLNSSPFSVLVDDGGEVIDKTPGFEGDAGWGTSIRKQDEDVVQRLRQNRPLDMQDQRQLYNLQKIIDGCYESARTGREVVF